QCSILFPSAVAVVPGSFPAPLRPQPANAGSFSCTKRCCAVAGSNSCAPDLGCCGRRRTLSARHPLAQSTKDRAEIGLLQCQPGGDSTGAGAGPAKQVFELFTRHHTCYDLIPTSSKLLVFDTNLNVRKAFFALVYNGLRAAPLLGLGQAEICWHTHCEKLRQSGAAGHTVSALVPMEVLETHRISTWQAELSSQLKPLTWISPEASLYDAIRVLLHSRVHRLPVIDPLTGNALYIVTHKRVLKFICLYATSCPCPAGWTNRLSSWASAPILILLRSAGPLSLVKVLSLFVQNRVSALPNLAATKTYNNLDISVAEALQYRRERFEGVSKCSSDATLKAVIDQLVQDEVHRLVIVDQDNRVTGMVSLSDVLNALVRDYERLADHCSPTGRC
uniref:5'-AMP-activated protein kinase subunit gamma-2 n=1 Tax=Macrostomum lignano TaxID=282301 RepID=A0A1I8FNV2_9PLAT